MSNNRNITLVRSPASLIADDIAGYGWGTVNFSDFNSASDICAHLTANGISLKRQKNQIKRFFELKKNDLVIIPVYKAIIIGKVEGKKSYVLGIKNGENRVHVKYYKDKDGSAIKIPRSKLSQGLESRLKLRMSIASLNDFYDEIIVYVKQLEESKTVCFDSIFQQKKESLIESFKQSLLSSLVNGQTTLESGGYGLELLVKELLQLEGYTAHIEAKNQSAGISDVDITATRNDPVSSNRVFVQVKHHKGNTSDWAVRQLIDIDEDEHHDKWVITTGRVDDTTRNFAFENGINIMAGEDLVDWIFIRFDELSAPLKEQLGAVLLPQMLTQ
ncbi:restriction endonuclease [Glaciecola sp. MH2013]|uniref:restriction endonuclease n=1 Tax=Glaciecola sp. MH2013 TaxID=2785524 RepID=UPI00189CA73F|nr:restriction endonuclease [Glaciecola sp. MH2013]MBF7073454.1 restriction endonuclease [Glaciecola sp. MH2013]